MFALFPMLTVFCSVWRPVVCWAMVQICPQAGTGRFLPSTLLGYVPGSEAARCRVVPMGSVASTCFGRWHHQNPGLWKTGAPGRMQPAVGSPMERC